jgi:hypothetical protein
LGLLASTASRSYDKHQRQGASQPQGTILKPGFQHVSLPFVSTPLMGITFHAPMGAVTPAFEAWAIRFHLKFWRTLSDV